MPTPRSETIGGAPQTTFTYYNNLLRATKMNLTRQPVQEACQLKHAWRKNKRRNQVRLPKPATGEKLKS